ELDLRLARAVRMLGCRQVDEDVAVLDEGLDRGARAPGEVRCEERVEPHLERVGARAEEARVHAQLDFLGRLGQVAVFGKEAHERIIVLVGEEGAGGGIPNARTPLARGSVVGLGSSWSRFARLRRRERRERLRTVQKATRKNDPTRWTPRASACP